MIFTGIRVGGLNVHAPETQRQDAIKFDILDKKEEEGLIGTGVVPFPSAIAHCARARTYSSDQSRADQSATKQQHARVRVQSIRVGVWSTWRDRKCQHRSYFIGCCCVRSLGERRHARTYTNTVTAARFWSSATLLGSSRLLPWISSSISSRFSTAVRAALRSTQRKTHCTARSIPLATTDRRRLLLLLVLPVFLVLVLQLLATPDEAACASREPTTATPRRASPALCRLAVARIIIACAWWSNRSE